MRQDAAGCELFPAAIKAPGRNTGASRCWCDPLCSGGRSARRQQVTVRSTFLGGLDGTYCMGMDTMRTPHAL